MCGNRNGSSFRSSVESDKGLPHSKTLRKTAALLMARQLPGVRQPYAAFIDHLQTYALSELNTDSV
jgi:hypothetical protein